jgi:hypothetical protein
MLFQVVGRMVQFNSCISSKQFCAWLFIWLNSGCWSCQAHSAPNPLETLTFNLRNCSLSVSSHAIVSITASHSTTFHYMQGIDTFINNWFASITLLVFGKTYFHFLLSKTYVVIIIFIKLHGVRTPIVRDLHCGNILRCAFSLILCFKLFLCLIFSGLWLWVRRMIISIFKTSRSDRFRRFDTHNAGRYFIWKSSDSWISS